ncbi:PRAME family member 12-like [Urocitellus parryii]
MSIQSPPTLLELAGCSLLSNKSRAILDLEDLPIELFPPLFVEQERLLSKLTSQFLRMDCLRKFCVDAVLLLEGHLEQVLRHLKTPLEALSITNCPLSYSDWNYLSRCPNTSQLRRLDLRGIKLTSFSPETLQILLETVAATLNRLDLEACEMTDSQLQAILPALSRCSQLRILCFLGNCISMSALRDLLLHTARLSQLSIELYPAPLESYDAQGGIHGRHFALSLEGETLSPGKNKDLPEPDWLGLDMKVQWSGGLWGTVRQRLRGVE